MCHLVEYLTIYSTILRAHLLHIDTIQVKRSHDTIQVKRSHDTIQVKRSHTSPIQYHITYCRARRSGYLGHGNIVPDL